jgi:hypothetical protein
METCRDAYMSYLKVIESDNFFIYFMSGIL